MPDVEHPRTSLEKDRGNPGVLELNPNPYPFKTRTLVRGTGFQPLGVRVEQG
jgi:hypothetical protein